jgi:hypothetical protein
MARLRVALVHVTVAASTLLCVAAAILWVRGYWRFEAANVQFQPTNYSRLWYEITIYNSAITGVEATQHWAESTPHCFQTEWISSTDHDAYDYPRSPATWWEKMGFNGYLTTERQMREEMAKPSQGLFSRLDAGWMRFEAPHWFLVALFAILPTRRLVSIYRKRNRQGNLCLKCGYDLRATPHRCPECGNAPPPRRRLKSTAHVRFIPMRQPNLRGRGQN